MADAEKIKMSKLSFAAFAGDAMIAYIYDQVVRFLDRLKTDSIPKHDPLTIAAMFKPDICEDKKMFILVITVDGKTRGI